MTIEPTWESVEIPERKLDGYLLSEEHDEGKAKAKFFLGHGYTVSTLDTDLRKAVRLGTVSKRLETFYGTKFVVDCKLVAPSGQEIELRSVWILDLGESRPRLVTAYPNR